jgi:hypothetical protein
LKSRGARLVCALMPLLLLLTLRPSATGAQTSVQLAFGGSVSFGTPTAADFTAAVLEAETPLSYQVTTTAEPVGSFTTTVSIRSSSPTLGGGKSLADLEWRRGDDATWHALTTVDVTVESRVNNGAVQGHTWDNTIFFRVALHWASDAPASYTGNLVVTVSTIQP